METIAGAIIGALVAGAKDVAKASVRDAYFAAKDTLKKFLPTFDVEAAQTAPDESVEAELDQRLGGLLEDERAQIVAEFKKLAEVADLGDASRLLGDTTEFKRVAAKGDIDVNIETSGRDKFTAEDVSSGGKLQIKKTIKDIR